MSEEENTGPWPDYSGLSAYMIPKWMLASVIEIVEAYGDKARMIYADLWVHNYYNDNNNNDPRGTGDIAWSDHKDRPSEDDLDHLPAMRRMYRRANELWHVVPFDADDEGNTNGEMSYTFTREGFEYKWDRSEYTEESDFFAEAKIIDGEWEYVEKIIITNFDISETALAMNDTAEILQQISADDMGLATMPDITQLTHEYDDDEGTITIIAHGGGLFEHFECSVV